MKYIATVKTTSSFAVNQADDFGTNYKDAGATVKFKFDCEETMQEFLDEQNDNELSFCDIITVEELVVNVITVEKLVVIYNKENISNNSSSFLRKNLI